MNPDEAGESDREGVDGRLRKRGKGSKGQRGNETGKGCEEMVRRSRKEREEDRKRQKEEGRKW